MAYGRMAARSIQPLDQLLLTELLIASVSFQNLDRQLDRLEGGETTLALLTLSPAADRIRFRRFPGICDFMIVMLAKGTFHLKL